jgi:hypothetical protein
MLRERDSYSSGAYALCPTRFAQAFARLLRRVLLVHLINARPAARHVVPSKNRR